MTNEEAFLHVFDPGNDIFRQAMRRDLEALLAQAREEERAACADLLAEAATRIYGGRKRINQVDTHVADVLRMCEEKIRARGSGTDESR
jgi:membrane protein required for beta-lactamase induction